MFVLREGEPVFVPLLVSVLLAYALEPFIGALMRLRMPRGLAVVVLYVIIAASAIGLARGAQTGAHGLVGDLPPPVRDLRTALPHTSSSRPPNRARENVVVRSAGPDRTSSAHGERSAGNHRRGGGPCGGRRETGQPRQQPLRHPRCRAQRRADGCGDRRTSVDHRAAHLP